MTAKDAKRTTSLAGVLVVVAPTVAFLFVLLTGFFALSDDDYARVVIAQRFARAPAWDPSGTSWLPFPFWLNGAAMAVFGPSLATAKIVALASSIVSGVLLGCAARWSGASTRVASYAVLVAWCLPTTARLGSSLQPEVLTAALVVLAASTTSLVGWRRVIGSLSLLVATLSRYEAWPVAAAFAAFSLWDASRVCRSGVETTPRRFTALAAALAALGPILWTLHGALHHHDALFYLHRVAAYKRALGESSSLASALFGYPAAAFVAEPEVCVGFIAACFLTWRARQRGDEAPGVAWRRPAVVMAALLAFLAVGSLLDGAPTHHAERPLLPVLWCAVVYVAATWSVVSTMRLRMTAIVFAVGLVVRISRPESTFAPRIEERAVGRLARILGAPALVIDTPDYGYLAVTADYQGPEHAAPLLTHDPRERETPPWDDLGTLRRAIDARCPSREPCWFVVHTPHLELASELGETMGRAGHYTLIRVAAAPQSR